MFNKWKVIYHIHESDLGKAAEFAITVHGKGETGPIPYSSRRAGQGTIRDPVSC
jgi:hypothetical protein